MMSIRLTVSTVGAVQETTTTFQEIFGIDSQMTSIGRPMRRSSTASSAIATIYPTLIIGSGSVASLRTVQGAVRIRKKVNFLASETTFSATCRVTEKIFVIFPIKTRAASSAIREKTIYSSAPSSVLYLAVWDSLPSINVTSNAEPSLVRSFAT